MDRRQALRHMGTALALPVLSPGALDALTASAARCSGSPAVRTGALSDQEFDAVTRLADIILPETDTPGALDAGVPEFIDLIVAEWYETDEADRFRSGLETLEASAQSQFDAPFNRLSDEDADALVANLADEWNQLAQEAERAEEAGGSYDGPSPSHHFFYQMKWLTLTGFFTSQPGMTGTGYRIIPGRFEGCVVG